MTTPLDPHNAHDAHHHPHRRRPFVGGNWKMNADRALAWSLTRDVADRVGRIHGVEAGTVEVAIFPPFPYLLAVGSILRERGSGRAGGVRLGAQDVSPEPGGAFTGEVSVAMLRDCGVWVVITGHSERRHPSHPHALGESDQLVNAKTRAVLEGGLACILCVGETLAQREAGETDRVNERQVVAGLAGVDERHLADAGPGGSRLTIAYEPVWAIGTGRNAAPEDAQDAQHKIRKLLAGMYGRDIADSVRIQYGGSVKASNAESLFSQPDVDGGLIGGASLNGDEFAAIVAAAARPMDHHIA